MSTIEQALQRLEYTLQQIGPVAVAVSGGVDSLTLAHIAHRTAPENSTVFHAVSPAVPTEATARVQRHAERAGWHLQLINAGEYADPDYRRNPVDRCFYCKTHLYETIAQHTRDCMVSGANLDDLGDYRPGLHAAEQYRVRHPFIEAEIDKATIRALARSLALDDIAELPAAPCLSSRIETGITIQADDLVFVHQIERLLRDQLQPSTVRCRVRRGGIHIELDEQALMQLDSQAHKAREAVIKLCQQHGHTTLPSFEAYRQGSAFLHPE